jgi:hypothetical protein
MIADLAAALIVAALAGLLVRNRASICWSFFAYLLVALTTNRLSALWPARFFELTFWSTKETVLDLLKIFIALEIWQRSFSAFPRARVRVGLLLAGALLATAVAVWTLPTNLPSYDTLVGVLYPRQQAGTLLVFAVLVSAAAWHRVPLHPLHRSILVGFGICLTLSAALSSFVGFRSSEVWLDLLRPYEQLTYVAATLCWTWAAWRPQRSPSPIVSRLQPWAHSW